MNKPKHIVIDARVRRASTGRYSDRLVEHLQDIDHFHRYTILVQPDDPWKMRAKNFTTVPLPYPQFSYNPLDQIGYAWKLYRLKPDLVHFTMTQQPMLYFGKIVTTTHDLTMFNFVRRGTTPPAIFAFKMFLYKVLFRWSHMKSNKIVVPTKYVEDALSSYQPATKDKIVVTYESGELPKTGPAEKPSIIGEHDKFIMYLGTGFPHKNLERLVDAFDILHKKHPELKLIFVGKKEKHYEALEQLIQSHPSSKQIIVAGYLPDEQAKWLHQHCQAYIFPSMSEGFGLPALESMGYGAAVVSANVTSMPELYEDAAYYFNPYNVQDMADKINDVLTNKKLRDTLRKKARPQYEKYSWHKMAEETLTVYKEVLGETINA